MSGPPAEERRQTRERIEECDEGYVRRERAVQRLGWVPILLLPVLGLLGLLGSSGPLATRTVAAGDVTIEHDRVARFGRETLLRVRAPGGLPGAEVALSSAFLDRFEVGGVSPAPASETTTAGAHVFRFHEPAPEDVRIRLTPRACGRASGEARLGDDSRAHLAALLLP